MESTTEPTGIPLTAVDRCDRCGAQAYVRATLMTGDLLFCAHHWRGAQDKVTELAILVHDETSTLADCKPSISANAD